MGRQYEKGCGIMRGRKSFAEIGKYTAILLTLIYIIFLLTGMSGSNKPFEDVAAPLQRALENTELIEVNGQGFRHTYGINPAELAGVMMFASEFRLSAEEVLLIEARDSEQVSELLQRIEEQLQDKRNRFGNHAPEEIHYIDNAQLTVRGNHIFLAIGPQATEFRQIFVESL